MKDRIEKRVDIVEEWSVNAADGSAAIEPAGAAASPKLPAIDLKAHHVWTTRNADPGKEIRQAAANECALACEGWPIFVPEPVCA